MPHIVKLKLHNFKRFIDFDISFNSERNLILGDNEAGKSSILTALELVISGSRSRVDAIGIDNLLNVDEVKKFLAGTKKLTELPKLLIEIYLDGVDNLDLDGINNSGKNMARGLKLTIEPNMELQNEINDVLASGENNFPFEFYVAKFTTFSGEAFSGFRKFLRHVLIDSSQINTDYAHTQYVKTMYEASVESPLRMSLQNEYRQQKTKFRDDNLAAINADLGEYDFSVKTGVKYNLETDLTLTEDDIPIENRGKGKQCFIKTAFALRERDLDKAIDVILLEEPENHLSHTQMNRLVAQIEGSKQSQVIIATHSSLICTRLNLRNATLLNKAVDSSTTLAHLSNDTAKFFMKAPNNNILELVLSSKVILVEGDAEYILIEDLYCKLTASTLDADGIHIISVGGTSFKRYMELAKLLDIQVAVIRDNDGNYKENCVENYDGLVTDRIKVFSDTDNTRTTFEICLYKDNSELCDALFGERLRTNTPQDYMLANKTECAFKILEQDGELTIPQYILEAIQWIKG